MNDYEKIICYFKVYWEYLLESFKNNRYTAKKHHVPKYHASLLKRCDVSTFMASLSVLGTTQSKLRPSRNARGTTGAIINGRIYDKVNNDRLHARRETPLHIIVVGFSAKFGERTRQSYYRNDPMKYDLVRWKFLNFTKIKNIFQFPV